MILFSLISISMALKTSMWSPNEQLGEPSQFPLPQSRIPQFILDTGHPWIVENQQKLESLLDAESYLCLSSELKSDTTLPGLPKTDDGLLVPQDLFDSIQIDNTFRSGSDYPGWPYALLRLQEIHRCPAALAQVKTFRAAVYAYEHEYSDFQITPVPTQLPTEVPYLLADVLGNMTNLDMVQWSIQMPDVESFQKHFNDRGLVLPSVKKLEIAGTSASHFLVPMCPNITVLNHRRFGKWGNHDKEGDFYLGEILLLQATTATQKLKRFAAEFTRPWSEHTIKKFATLHIPSIESLGLYGLLQTGHRFWWVSDAPELRKLLVSLNSLKNLTHIDLPEALVLGVGFDCGRDCRNHIFGSKSPDYFFGPKKEEYYRTVTRDEVEAVHRVANIVVQYVPRLTSFSVDDTEVNLTRYENGTVKMSFDWTGELVEWVTEVVPPYYVETEYDADIDTAMY
ncbi:hypothetical protein F4777DRAFT_592561 [Nemania sp. FL0916]|nr:hypothetical protein F4777DRAFT_592561 [Nemania sp. FL0916]